MIVANVSVILLFVLWHVSFVDCSLLLVKCSLQYGLCYVFTVIGSLSMYMYMLYGPCYLSTLCVIWLLVTCYVFFVMCSLLSVICSLLYAICVMLGVHCYVLSAPRCCYCGNWLLDICSLLCVICYVVIATCYMLCVLLLCVLCSLVLAIVYLLCASPVYYLIVACCIPS